MSGTRRTPITRRPGMQITAEAVRLFEAMSKLKCSCPVPKPVTQGPCPGCLQWYDLHAALHEALGCEPWEWPCVARQPKRAGSAYMNADIAARMQLLKDAAKARRTSSKISKADERDTDVESVAGEEPRI
jgi:hypothetical protein